VLAACSPRVGLVGPPDEEAPSVLQDVSSRPRILYRRFSDLLRLLSLLLSSYRYADTGMLSLVHLKRLAQSARVVPSEPRPQPPCSESLPRRLKRG
jgi:hypothetical protein